MAWNEEKEVLMFDRDWTDAANGGKLQFCFDAPGQFLQYSPS